MRYRSGIRAIAAVAIVTVVAFVALAPTQPALGIITPLLCGKGAAAISASAARGPTHALAAKANPYRVVATYYYKERKRPQDKRVMRLGTAGWGFTHIRARRKWSTGDTYVIVGCVLTFGKSVARQGHAYTFQYRFPKHGTPDLDLAGREYQVIYESGGAPKGVITAYESGVIG